MTLLETIEKSGQLVVECFKIGVIFCLHMIFENKIGFKIISGVKIPAKILPILEICIKDVTVLEKWVILCTT